MGYMTVWMYYEDDESGGYYNIKLFSSEEKAVRFLHERANPYGKIEQISIK